MNKENNNLTELNDKIAGHLASSWLPSGTTRKVMLLILLIVAIKSYLESDYLFAILMFGFAILFSPRAIGEVVHLTGRVVGMIGRFFKFFN